MARDSIRYGCDGRHRCSCAAQKGFAKSFKTKFERTNHSFLKPVNDSILLEFLGHVNNGITRDTWQNQSVEPRSDQDTLSCYRKKRRDRRLREKLIVAT